jgi:UDP:flavonoid glycosyltransferase YjiC (YdhE family)
MKIGIQTWGSEGDIRPFVALAAGLTRAGHEVTLVATDGAERDYQPLAAAHGVNLKMVATPVIKDPEEGAAIVAACVKAGNPVKQSRIIIDRLFTPALAEMSRAGGELAAESDLLIRHFFLYPLGIAAARAGVPEVSVMLAHNCLPSREIAPPGMPDLGRWFHPLAWRVCQTVVNRMFLGEVNRQRTLASLRPQGDLLTETWVAERLNLIAVSPSICRAPADWHPRHQVCGFFDLPPTRQGTNAPELEDFLAAGPPPIYMTFGSLLPATPEAAAATLALWREAARLAGCRAILQGPAAAWSAGPSDPEIFCLERAAHRQVFPRCAAVVHHGGAGTTQTTLLAGAPSVVVAHVADQFFWGDELRRLGVGGKTLVRKALSAAKLSKAIAEVLARPGFRRAAQTLGTKLAGEDGVGTAVQCIEELFTCRGRN